MYKKILVPLDGSKASAAAERADLIAMGTHGRRGFERLGSVAEGVMRRATIPVLLLPGR